MKVKIFNLIMTYDVKNGKTVLLSSDNDTIILPNFEINNPKNIHQEIRKFIKNLFNDNNLKYIELINISFMEIQNELLIDYIKSIKSLSYDENEELCIFVGVVLTEKNKTDLFWLPISYPSIIKEKSVIKSSPIDILADYVIKNTVL